MNLVKKVFFLLSVTVVWNLLDVNIQAANVEQNQLVKSTIPTKNNAVQFEIFAHGTFNYHSANFAQFPGFPKPPQADNFGNTTRLTATFGLGMEVPWFNSFGVIDRTSLSIRLAYQSYSAELTANESTSFIINNQLVAGNFLHSIDAKLSSLAVEPLVNFYTFDFLKFSLGFRVGSVIEHTFAQRREITIPSVLPTELNDQRSIAVYPSKSGEYIDIPEAKTLQTALLFGIGVPLSINKNNTFILSPEMFGQIPFSKIGSVDWEQSALRIGLAFSYKPIEKKEIPILRDTVRFYDTTTIFVEGLQYPRLSLVGIDKAEEKIENNGIVKIITGLTSKYQLELPKTNPKQTKPWKLDVEMAAREAEGEEFRIFQQVRIDEEIKRRFFPLLNYVFFEYNSDKIPQRYQQLSKNKHLFSWEAFADARGLDTYYAILDIVGKRMNERPQSSLTIKGCYSYSEQHLENKEELSRNRAEAIAQYLKDTWNISSHRIIALYGALPEKATKPLRNNSDQENARAELYSNDPGLLSYIESTVIEREIEPRSVSVRTRVATSEGLQSWTISARGNNVNEIAIIDSGNGLNFPTGISFRLLDVIKNNSDSLTFSVNVRDKSGKEREQILQYPIIRTRTEQLKKEHLVADQLEFGLMLFEYNNNSLTQENKGAIEVVKAFLRPDDEVVITGRTDESGSEQRNKILSMQRAKEVERRLQAQKVTIQALGERQQLYNNSLPEGRFYNRTVTVSLRHKTK